MTKTLSSTLLLLGVAAGLTSATAAAQNLAVNGDFETGDTSSWVNFPTANSTFAVTADANTGGFAGQIFNDDPASAAVHKQANLGVGTVNPFATVDISFAAKGTGMVGGVAFAEFFSEISGGGVSSAELLGGAPLSITSSWQTFNFTVDAGNNTSGGITLQFAAVTGGAMGSTIDLFIDDVVITATNTVVQLAPYAEDFEGLDAMSGSALGDAGFLGFANVFDSMGGYLYGYGPFPAPNNTPGFSSVAVGQGGMDQGAQGIVTYSDYNNADHGIGNIIESNVFQEQIVGANDVGKSFTFEFDAKLGDLIAPSTASAFIKIIDSATFALDGLASMDTTALPTSWGTYSVSITIEPQHVGDFFQFGFQTNATGFNASGIVYDNINFAESAPVIALSPYSEDFEALDAMSGSALGDAGFLGFANVFDSMGGYLYGYGPFPAPNGTPGFSSVATGQGGPDQGAQGIVTYSDYNNADHGIGNIIQSNVFQEQIVGATDVGKSFTFQFDAKLGDLIAPSTASAFIKIIDGTNFGLDGYSPLDTTTLPTTWGTYSVSITIEPQHVGDFFQFGFQTDATGFNASGIVYDNLVFGESVLGTNYCSTTANSSGSEASMSASGSDLVADNDFTLIASDMPAGEFGLFIVSADQGFFPGLNGNSNGNLCVQGSIGRFLGTGQLLMVDGAGSFSLPVDLTAIPQGLGSVPTTPGQTWNFQAWFRDSVGVGSNLTDGLEVTFN